VRKRARIDLTGVIKDSPLKERVSVLDEFRALFRDMIIALAGRRGRVVVFVDDLDRCQPERIVQVLDAIKLFLDVPGCVYVLGLDREIIEQAVKTKFENYDNPSEEAQQYLEKIISLPFDLPPLSEKQMKDLVGGLNPHLPEEERSTEIFALGQDPNPRKVKRTINVFLLLWGLGQRRHELRYVLKACRLAKIVVIQQSYRELSAVLSATPGALAELEIHFRSSGMAGATESLSPNQNGAAEEIEDVATSANGPDEVTLANLPEYLKPFATNERLGRLLTLHSGQDESDYDDNFTIWQGDGYERLSESEIRVYLQLTRSIRLDQEDLRQADLRGADLSNANLVNKDLSEANLADANLTNSLLSGANLSGANLSGVAAITNEELAQQAASLEGATMPNGQTYENWLKSKRVQQRERQTRGIYISYRRDESAVYAGRIADSFIEQFGEDRVFRDIDTIQPGLDFAEAIEHAVGSSEVLIAVIGKNWLTATDEAGQKRLENPDDYVRTEIATALQLDIRVVPLLVQGASMPGTDELPEDLAPLTRRNAFELHDSSWGDDIRRLTSVLERVMER
jgi:hypothetical protein